MICPVSDQPLSGLSLREENQSVLLSQYSAILFDCCVCVLFPSTQGAKSSDALGGGVHTTCLGVEA